MKNCTKIGYKVVCVKKGLFRTKYYSFNIKYKDVNSVTSTKLKDGIIKYKIGKWVYPKRGRGSLAVFTEYSLAESFLLFNTIHDWFGVYKIFKCEYVESLEDSLYTKRHITIIGRLPKGTSLATKVRLIEEVPQSCLT